MKAATVHPRRPHIVFIEAWINPIFVGFAKEFARQHEEWDVTYITDSDALPDGAAQFVHSRVRLIGLQNIRMVRRIAYLPLYVGGMVSPTLRARYADSLYLHTYRGLAKTLEDIQPDIIQSNVFVMPYTIQASRYASKHKIPFILRTEERAPHTLAQRIALNLLLIVNKRCIHDALLIIPWTTQSAAFARSQLVVPANRIALLPAGVDTNKFAPGKRAKVGAGKALRLLAVQRFVPYKDYPTLLHGVRRALDNGSQLTLSILGSGPEEAAIHTLVQQLRLGDVVTFLPAVPYEKMPALYRAHDVLVLTGRHEAIGMVVPEAMACGVLPVVCDTAGAITYITKETGFVFKTGDASALARVLSTLKPDLVRRMGVAAGKSIASKFSIAGSVRAYTRLLKMRGVRALS